MVLGVNAKNKKGASVHVNYLIHIQDIKPWPPSQSLRSLRSVLIQWENGNRHSGSTDAVVPSIGSIVGEGKIEFNESFRLPVTLVREMSGKGKDGDSFQKNCIEFNLYEPRRDKLQLLANAVIDLADYGVVNETIIVTAPMNSNRSFKNTSQPVLYVKIRPVDKGRTSSSSLRDNISKGVSQDKKGAESVSALMHEEYAEETEVASFTDDDVSSHSSLTNGGSRPQNEEKGPDRLKENKGFNEEKAIASELGTKKHISSLDNLKEISSCSSSVDLSSDIGSPVNSHTSVLNSPDNSSMSMPKTGISRIVRSSSLEFNREGKEEEESPYMKNNGHNHFAQEIDDKVMEDEPLDASPHDGARNEDSLGADILLSSGSVEMRGNILNIDRSKHVKSVRSSSDSVRVNGWIGRNHYNELQEVGALGDTQNSAASLKVNERKNSKVYPQDARTNILNGKIQHLERKIKMLEGELREAAGIEAALYSVVAEHGSSMSKVHAPARRLSRLYLHSYRESSQPRKASTARSCVSGLVLVAKACGNDVPRLTFWLSNSVVLRAIISQATSDKELPSDGKYIENNGDGRRNTTTSSLKWKMSPSCRKENTSSIYRDLHDFDGPDAFISALERVEAWIFSRIVESIWWQTLTPHMQSAATKAIGKFIDCGSKKNLGRALSSCDQDQGNFSVELWKQAFKDACERLCPVRAGGHECGCLPVLPRLIMEQCVSRLDVAMFNAILRESTDEIPTDPVSDPISDLKVLPIPAGKSSFSAGAQLKNAIGNWSRWLTDLFGMDDDLLGDDTEKDEDDDRQDSTFKSFHLLNALSDLMMLPKDMLLSKSIRKEVCPTFGAPLIKGVLDNFVSDEFCPDPILNVVLEALDSEDIEVGEESVSSIPHIAAPPFYSPPSADLVAESIGESGSKLVRSGSLVRKSYTSDDELEELNSPLSLIFNGVSRSSPSAPTRLSWKSKEMSKQNSTRYELLRDVWTDSE